MARVFAIAVLCLALAAPVAFAQYGNSARSPVSSRGAYTSGKDRFYVSSVTLAELKGVWKMEGMEAPNAQVVSNEESAMPDCGNDNVLPNYIGLDYDAGRYYVIAGSSSGPINVMNINQQRSTFSSNATYSNGLIAVPNPTTGAVTCTHFQTYIDVATGILMAESLAMTISYPNTTAGAKAPIRDRPACYLTGREQVGCYPAGREVTLGAAIPQAASPTGSPTGAPSVAITSIPGVAPQASRPANAVVTVSKNTYSCLQGECLRLSPKHSSTSPAYGC